MKGYSVMEKAMPREQITYPGEPYYVDGDGGETLAQLDGGIPKGAIALQSPLLHVNWQNSSDTFGGHVQLSFEVSREWLLNRAENIARDELVTSHGMFTEPLNRAEINKLIRVLRTARDKALGRDE